MIVIPTRHLLKLASNNSSPNILPFKATALQGYSSGTQNQSPTSPIPSDSRQGDLTNTRPQHARRQPQTHPPGDNSR